MNERRLIILLIILLLTGCSRTLDCKIKTDNYQAKVSIVFKNGAPRKYLFKDKMSFKNSPLDKYFYLKKKKREYKPLTNYNQAKIIETKNKVKTSINYNFLKENDYNKNKLLINKNDNIKSSIKKIESYGYKCR